MKLQSSTKQLLSTASVLALSATALLASAAPRPANAQISEGIYAGGSTLASEAFRQIFDCYSHTTVGGDNFSFTTGAFPTTPTPGVLPSTCPSTQVQGMYAGVGSGNGFRGYISNKASQWYGGTVTPNTTTDISITPPFPAAQPPFVDSSNTNFGNYPYPRVDIGLSDSPLASTVAALATTAFSFSPTWSTAGGSMTQITLGSTTTAATYNTSSYGQPIQVPAFEVNVAIPVNVNSTSFQINSQIKDASSNIVQGGAIQLSTAQLCAIFSGLVTDWHDTTTNIPTLDASGNVTAVAFDYANVGSVTTAQAYSNASLPITVVYRSDGSGTSFIITNYLHAVCPLLAPVSTDPTDQYKYRAIFGAVTPGTTFSTALIAKITAARGNGAWNGSATTGNWLGETGSGGVAATISDGSAQAGYIGYVSADFTKPYANHVSGAGLTGVDAPLEASLQNEDLRINGTSVPNTSTTAPTFIAPTPTSADKAWSSLNAPNSSSTYADWNVYAQTISTTQGGVTLSGQSALPLTNVQGAYPLSGTTFLAMYTCYNDSSDAARVSNLTNFLTWYYTAPTNPTADQSPKAVVENNGFHLVSSGFAQAVLDSYLSGNPLVATSILGSTGGCANGEPGAN